MTTEQFIAKQQAKIAELVKANKPLALAVKSVMALQSDRIFLKGKNKFGAPIGTYENNEVRINPNKSPKKFTPKGKEGNTTKKNGEPYKTGYFSNWLSYKKAIGKNKNVSTVDLFWTGELLRNWANAGTDSNALKQPNAVKIDANTYQVGLSEHNANKVKRYGLNDVFGINKFEKDMFLKAFQFETNRFLNL
jgi:hypothetical protein